jgi:ABC-type antimicrobial peptide transport system permease subunit
MQSFLASTLIVVICFLAILSSQLLYSLMLSDVDTKTYEYGMLRALGFKSSHLVSMITI